MNKLIKRMLSTFLLPFMGKIILFTWFTKYSIYKGTILKDQFSFEFYFTFYNNRKPMIKVNIPTDGK